jgi:hypothetical protein
MPELAMLSFEPAWTDPFLSLRDNSGIPDFDGLERDFSSAILDDFPLWATDDWGIFRL